MNKEKIKDLIITSSVTLLLGGLVALGTFGCHQLSKVSAEEEEQPLLTQPLKASYDDNSYTITLSDIETLYTYNNLANYIINNIDSTALQSTRITYNGYDYIELNPSAYEYLNVIRWGSGNPYFYLIISDNNYYFSTSEVNVMISYGLTLTSNNDTYSGLKQAIELDIQANNLLQYDFYLSSYQLNNYTYQYLANQINDNATSSDFENTYLMYNGYKYVFSSLDLNDNLTFIYNNYQISIYLDDNGNDFGVFTLYNSTLDENLPFTNSVYFYNAEFLQDNLNAPVNWLSFLNSFISLLTGGLVTTASALGSGISAYVGSILVTGSSMSAFASVIFIFGGIALAFTLGRWVLNFITSLGNRNR